VLDEVVGPSSAEREDRRALGHRLRVDESEGLVPARQGEELCPRHHGEHAGVLQAADEVDLIAHARRGGLLLQGAAQGSVADDREPDPSAVAMQPADGGDEVGGPLARDQLAHGEDDRLPGTVV